MHARIAFLVVLTLVWVAPKHYAQVPTVSPSLPRYPAIKTRFNQTLSQLRSSEAVSYTHLTLPTIYSV